MNDKLIVSADTIRCFHGKFSLQLSLLLDSHEELRRQRDNLIEQLACRDELLRQQAEAALRNACGIARVMDAVRSAEGKLTRISAEIGPLKARKSE